MASDRFEIEPAPREKSGWGGCLTGCLIGAGIAFVIGVLGIWWVSNNWKVWLVSGGTQALEASIDGSDLADQEKVELKAELTRLREGFLEGKISDEQMMEVVEQLVQSPLMSIFMVSAVETGYVVDSGLDDQEKAEAKVTLQRFASGMMDEKISEEDLNEVLAHISDRDAEGNLELRDQVTDDELRAFLAAAAQKADAAGVAEEIEPVDPSDELKRIVDGALGEE